VRRILSVLLAMSFVIGMFPLTVSAQQRNEESPKMTIYTAEMRENALRNVQKYDWARELRDEAVKAANRHIENLDILYERMPGEGIPRSYTKMEIVLLAPSTSGLLRVKGRSNSDPRI